MMRSGRVQQGENTQQSGENRAVKPVKPENVSNLQHDSQIDNKLFVHNWYDRAVKKENLTVLQ